MELGFGGIHHPDPHRRAQNRRIRAAELDALRAWHRVSDIDADTARRREADAHRAREVEVGRRMEAAVTAIAESTVGSRDDWLARLGRVTPTARSAADDLADLRADVDRFAHWMAVFGDVRGAGTGWPVVGVSPPWGREIVPAAQDWTERCRDDARQAEAISDALSELISAVRDLTAG